MRMCWICLAGVAIFGPSAGVIAQFVEQNSPPDSLELLQTAQVYAIIGMVFLAVFMVLIMV